MRMRPILTVIIFCSFLICGYKLATESWGGDVYVYLGEERAPAAVRNSSDYSAVKKHSVGAEVHQQLVRDAEVSVKDGSVGIHLGNPLLKTARGNEFACRVKSRDGLYDRIEMSFMGVGISVSGETPEMIVEAPCEAGSQASALQPIWIPVKQIFSQTAKDSDYQTDSDHPVNISLKHIPDEWPPQWVLSRVKMYRQDDGEYFLEVGGAQMRDARPSLLSFDSN